MLALLLGLPSTAAADSQVTAQPATAVAGTPVLLRGEGFPAGARVSVRARSKVIARLRADRRGRFSVSILAPAGGWQRLRLTTSARGRRVVGVLMRARPALPTEAEVASSTGARLRWSPTQGRPGAKLALRGAGLEPRARYRVALAGALWKGRASATGSLRLRGSLPAATPGAYRGSLRSRRLVLPFGVAIDPVPFPPPLSPPPGDTTPPTAPVIRAPLSGSLLTSQTLIVTGSAEPQSVVSLLRDVTPAGSVRADSTGAWTLVVTLREGSNELTATATDRAGNRSLASAPTRVTLDTIPPPAAKITAPPTGTRLVTTTSVALRGTAQPGIPVEVEDDELVERTQADSGGAWSLPARDVSDGLHVFKAITRDAAGNESVTRARVNVGTRLAAATAGPSRSTSARFAFAPDPKAAFECSLDGDAFKPCGPSPVTYRDLAAGDHVFRLRAVGLSGNPDPTPAEQRWTVDAASPPSAVRVAAAGDVSCPGVCGQAKTAALVKAINPIAVLGLGDYQYPFGTRENFDRYYNPTWGPLKATTYPINGGEHDFYGRGDYLTYFADSALQLQPEGSFSFDLGAWHVIALNSYCFERESCDDATVSAWLQADLAASTARCTLAYLHEPYWTSPTTVHSRQTRTAPWIQALYDAGADLLLQGHNHDYERFAPQDPASVLDPGRGLASFVVGTGGRGFYGFSGPAAANSVTRVSGTYGILSLDLRANAYDFAFVAEPGKSFTDSGTASCH
jgi:Big-like domain-containing protein